MRTELTQLGVKELRTPEEVDEAFEQAEEGTTLLIINSICGCAAANARPAVARARRDAEQQPDRYVTVFAGQDLEATERAREYLPGIPPSSPFMALFKDGTPVHIIQRKDIEGRSAEAIYADLENAFQTFCGEGSSEQAPSGEESGESSDADNGLPDSFRSIMN